MTDTPAEMATALETMVPVTIQRTASITRTSPDPADRSVLPSTHAYVPPAQSQRQRTSSDADTARERALEDALAHAEAQVHAKAPLDAVALRQQYHPVARDVAGTIGVSLLVMVVFGFVIGTAELKRYYLGHNVAGRSYKMISWIPTAQAVLTLALSPLFCGVRHAWRVVVPGTVMMFGALVSLAFCTRYYEYLLAHILFGLGASVWLPAVFAVTHHGRSMWYHRPPVAVGAGVGAVVYPIILRNLLVHLSFRDALLTTAGISGALMLPSWLLILALQHPEVAHMSWSAFHSPWRDAQFGFLLLGSSVYMINIFSPIFYSVVLTAASGISHNVEAYSVAIIGAGMAFGGFTGIVLTSRLPTTAPWSNWLLVTASGATTVVIFAFWTGAKGTGATVVGLLFYGITTGAWVAFLPRAVSIACPDSSELRARLCMICALGGIAGLAGPPVCAVLVHAGHEVYLYAGVYCGLTFLVGSFLLVIPQAIDGGDSGSDASDMGSLRSA